jgi:hypothetical protein
MALNFSADFARRIAVAAAGVHEMIYFPILWVDVEAQSFVPTGVRM